MIVLYCDMYKIPGSVSATDVDGIKITMYG